MRAYETSKIGSNRGAPRLWLEGMKAVLAGFMPGKRFNVRKDVEKQMLVLELSEVGFRVVSRKVKANKEVPVIDINSKELLDMYEGLSAVRIVVQNSRIVILPLAVDIAKQERMARLMRKLDTGEALSIGSIAHGGGVLSHALHTGLASAGVESKLSFANEIRADLMEQAFKSNDAWSKETIPLVAPMQYLAFDAWAMDKLPKVEIFEGGVPCSGASVAGRGKRGAGHAEAHPEVGHMVVPLLAMIAKVNPIACVIENVPAYGGSASMCIIRNFLRDFGYVVHETELDATDWNSHEKRKRLCVVAVSDGLQFDFSKLQRPPKVATSLADVLEEIAHDDPRWSPMQGLKDKQERDIAQGKGFLMQIVSPDDATCPTLTKGYAKVRSTDPKVQHPKDKNLLRQILPTEHCSIKQIPKHLIEGLSTTTAHELLGQSICYQPFVAVGRCIGHMLNALQSAVAVMRPTLVACG